MKYIATLLLCCSLAFAAIAQTPDPKEMEQQMKEMEQRLKEMEQRIKEMEREQAAAERNLDIPRPPAPPRAPRVPGDTSARRKVIIINGERMDLDSMDIDLDVLNDLNIEGDSMLLGDGMKIYENDDSVVVRLGNLRVKVDEDGGRVDRDELRNEIRNEIIIDTDKADDKKKKKKAIEGTSMGLRIGLNNYLYDGKFQTPPGYAPLELNTGKSIHVNLGLAGIKWRIADDYVTMHTGVALDFLNYRFRSNTAVLTPNVDSVSFFVMSDYPNVSKNKLAATYLEVPLRFQFQTNKKDKKAFRVSVGGRVAYRIGAHTKQVANDEKIKRRDDFNLTTLKYGLTGQIGFSYLNFYVNYDLTPVFEDRVQPKLMPVAAGIVLTGW